MIRGAKLSMITFKYNEELVSCDFYVPFSWTSSDLVMEQPDRRGLQIEEHCLISMYRAPQWRCQQMALGNARSSPRVAEAGEKFVP